MDKLKSLDSLVIREKKEYAGLAATSKWKPIFCLSNMQEEEIFYVAPFEKSVATLETLKAGRSYKLHLVDKNGKEILYFKKKSGLFEDHMEVQDFSEDLLGSVKKTGKTAKAVFEVLNFGYQVIYHVKESPSDPEVYHIYRGDEFSGKISRRLTRIVEEGIMKNDHFGIIFPFNADAMEKSILIGVLFFIDFSFLKATPIERKMR